MLFGLRSAASQLAELLFAESKKVKVTPMTAMSYPPIWYAVNKIAGHVGQLPLVLHRRLDNGGSERATEHPSFRLTKVRPNGWQTAITWKQQQQARMLLWGNAYCYIRKIGPRIVDLVPLDPGRTAPYVADGVKYYVHMPEDEHDAIRRFKRLDDDGTYITLNEDEILHLPGLGFDGYAGLSLWKVASDSWSIGLQSDKAIQSGFEKGFRSALMLEAPVESIFSRDAKAAREFIDEFNAYHTGSENAAKVGLLRGGVKANAVSMSGQEAQVIEHRRYQRQDAALWFLLEQILGDDSSVSYNSLEQKNLGYLSNCLMRWLVTWEEECNRKLLTLREQEQDTHYFKFNVAALLRADHKTTVETFALGINARIYSPNDARIKLDENPYEGGNAYENPSISPGTPGSGDQEEPPEQTAATNAIRSRMAHLVGVERNRVIQGCNSRNFTDWVDSFYDKWSGTLAKALEAFVPQGDPVTAYSIAAEHCDESKAILLDLAGKAMDEAELSAIVGEAVATWDSRGEGLVSKVEANV